MADENTTDTDDTTTSDTTTDEQQQSPEQESATDTSTKDDDKLGDGGKKALDAERAARKDLERELTRLRNAQKQADRDKLNETERAQAEAKDAAERAEAAERRAALLEAAVTHSLTKDELELLEDTPVDKVDARAKKLAALRKTAKTGSSGGEATGSRGPQKPTSLSGAIAAHYNQ